MSSIALHPSDRLWTPIAAALFACAILAAGAVFVGAAAADESAEVDEPQIVVNQSETAAIDVAVPDGDTVQVTIGSADGPLHVEATVTDSTGDGNVTLLVDTEAIADEHRDGDAADSEAPEDAVSVAGEDDLEDVAVHETPDAWALPAGDYDVGVGDPTAPDDLAVLTVQPQISIDHDDEPITVDAGDAVTVSGETHLEPGETVRISLRSTGDSPFLVASETTVESDGTFSGTIDVPELDDRAEFRLLAIHDGTEKAAVEGVVDGEPVDDDHRTDLDTDDRISIDHEGHELDLEAAPEQTVAGSTELEPGTTMRVRIRTEPSVSQPFLMDAETVVEEDGTFAATFDLSDQPGDTPVVVQVRSQDHSGTSTAVHGVVHTPLDDPSADDEAPNDVDIDDGIDTESAALGGGFLGGVGLLALGGLLAIVGVSVIAGIGPARDWR